MMYAGAGYVIELLSGNPWEAFVQERIFDPLGLSSSPPYWKSRVLRRQALGDEDDAQGRWVPQTA